MACGGQTTLFVYDMHSDKWEGSDCVSEQRLGWDDLRVVLAIGRAGSLNGAAKTLALSHPTVFRRVGAIERKLGARLFERSRAGYVPTAAGEAMIALAGRLENEILALERRLAGQDQRPSGVLRVTTTDTLLFGPLPPLLAAFRRQYPDITLELAAANTLFSLTKREADVAIRPSRNPPETLVGRKITDIATAVYRVRRGPAIDAAGLEEQDWVTPDDSLSDLPLSRWLSKHRFDRRSVYRANTLLALRDAVAQGLGVAVLPCYVGDPDPALARVGDPIEPLRSELWLVTHPDLQRVARVRAFLDGMRTLLLSLRPMFEGRVH